MTEQEAIKKLKYIKRNCGMPTQGDMWKPNAETIAINLAITALEEIQQYRELGTVEELKEAKEKQNPKKTIRVLGDRTDGCPECQCEFYEKHKYCPKCGTKIDWSEI